MFPTSRMTKRLLLSCAGAALALAGSASAQEQPPTPQQFELGIYGGSSFFKQKNDQLKTELMPSARGGLWIGVNPAEYFGLEADFGYAQNSLRFHQIFNGFLQPLTLDQRVIQFRGNALVYLKNRTSPIRPYFRIGLGADSFRPRDDAKSLVNQASNAGLAATSLSASTQAGLAYGGGLKFKLAEHFGFRADVGGLLIGMPHYKLLPSGVPPELYIAPRGFLQGLQISGGIMYVTGHKPDPIITAVAAPGFTGVTIDPSAPAAVCPPGAFSFTATIANVGPNHTPSYRWTVDGKNAGTNTNTFAFNSNDAGTHTIGLTVADNITMLTKDAAPVTVTINAHSAPTLTANADITDLQYGQSAKLYPHPTAGTCAGNLTVTWSASEGTVTGTDPAAFDSTGVTFDPNANGAQTKQIIVTATVTDDKGGSASTPVTLNITSKPKASRQDDLVFPTSNSRVNNCGKRLLIDVIYPALTSGQYANSDIIIVGHAGNEPPAKVARKGRHAKAALMVDLAHERAMNAAAVLISGEGICPRPGVDLSRIKIVTVGPGAGSDFRKPLCGASVKERKASVINGSDDQLKDQRVEIWIVPKGADAPAAASGATAVPDSIKALGCPK